MQLLEEADIPDPSSGIRDNHTVPTHCSFTHSSLSLPSRQVHAGEYSGTEFTLCVVQVGSD